MTSGRAPIPLRPGKDEFGRDLPTGDVGGNQEAPPFEQNRLPAHQQGMSPMNRVTTQTPAHPPAPVSQGMPPRAMGKSFTKPNLETFDRNTFDPSQPASWASLAEAWETSMGRPPNQMELMEWLMMGAMGMAGSAGGVSNGAAGMGVSGGGANMGGMNGGAQGGYGGGF